MIPVMRSAARRAILAEAALLAAMLAASCAKGDSAPAAPDPSPGTVITITSSGASPRALLVPQGGQVTFVNNDGSVHEMYSDPHPEHTDCPEFDSVGRLLPGQSRQTTNLVTVQVCSFHDHINPTNNALKGSITIR
jgi:hypothetical protein